MNQNDTVRKASVMAENLIPSEIIKLGNEINQRIKSGEPIFNLTIGDFDPSIFPLPQEMTEEIARAYKEGKTNYPAANGVPELRQILSKRIEKNLNVSYSENDILISAGARPLIYAVYKSIIDPGDSVAYGLPSWNNNHYCHLSGAQAVEFSLGPDDHFIPERKHLESVIDQVSLLALCSPQNPTGTTFTKEKLYSICELVLQENEKRKGIKKPLYLMYDQIYWQLCFGETRHVHPVELMPELKDYVIYIDGLSKTYAATGVRVGWAFGPSHIIDKMKSILSHVGAWAPKAEQHAVAEYLSNDEWSTRYLNWFIPEIEYRLKSLYQGIQKLTDEGFPIRAIVPEAAIYLTVQFPWKGYTTQQGKLLANTQDVLNYIIDRTKVAVVPFKAFGASAESDWCRISVGTLKKEDIPGIIQGLRDGMQALRK
ncbi:MAG TPA: pyridoxal phosphate-dependent aminotransferase [Saprospiraceae bacterium]|nr:pyridoxal phosphate-dependent aminotransferase [Saprospiraceae bacterium]